MSLTLTCMDMTMGWTITTKIFLSVLNAALGFNIDPVAWKSLSNSAESFGYQVVQRGTDLLVSAPLAQSSPRVRGEIYQCSTMSCTELQAPLPDFAVNMSLGLTMVNDPITKNTLACGPTIPKDCKSITMYNGMCFPINRDNRFGEPVPSSLEECRTQADIAFLLDGSGSVTTRDFAKMKEFVKNLVLSFPGKDTKFAIVQFSSSTSIHYNFNTFDPTNWEAQINNIDQLFGGTRTADAIRSVVQNVFSFRGGARPNVKKVLIVITDGQSQDPDNLPMSARLAEQEKIVRFAIGVGRAFSNNKAKAELGIIASSPPEEHVFQVESFDALEVIKQNLQDRIFSIEGSQTTGHTLEMEMSQTGFSAAFVPTGIQMAIVGADQWKGGFLQYTGRDKMLRPYKSTEMVPDSYLGYSMAVANTRQGPLTIAGAPRYEHRGAVMAIHPRRKFKIDPIPQQSGEYFGAEVCAMDVDQDTFTDLILISAPMFVESDREGRVYICSLNDLDVDCHFDSLSVLSGDEQGRFGTTLAVLPDLNADNLNDLAVGAPLENDGQGCVYIFHSEGRQSITVAYSQRIAGSEVMPGLQYFGMSISQSSYDLSMDSLPDLAVGSKGRVVLLRSKPIVMVAATMSFSPNLIPTQNTDCQKSLQNTAKVCFTMTPHSTVAEARAMINLTLTLDATRKVPNNRAYISEKQRVATRSTELDLRQPRCINVDFFVEACPEDALNALNNELKFTFDGLPSNANLSPSLSLQAMTASFHPLGFEIDCGSDNNCIDSLKVDFNFTRSLEVKVGIDELLNVTVWVENSGENSYNSRVIVTYPAGLSYRKFTVLQGRIECNSLDSDQSSRGRTDCTIDKPILKSGTTASFMISYGIESNSKLDRRIFVTANATSGNQDHTGSSELYKMKSIDVKYSIFVAIQSALSYSNFTAGYNDLQKPVQQSIVVTNDLRALNVTVVIRVPVKLGEKDIWVDVSSLQIPDCQRDVDEEPPVTDFVAQIQKNMLVDCSVARCRVFKCTKFMEKVDSKNYEISANLSSGWIGQIGLQSAKFLLTSTASLEYDRNQYIFFSTSSNNNPPVRKIEIEVEVYPEPDFTKAIVGGSLGGLAFLALLTAGLYKAGFFKSKLQEMKNNNAGGAGEAEGEPIPDQQI